MSQENVEIVRRINELWNEGGVVARERRPEFFDPELRMDLRGRKINPAVYEGYDGLDRFGSDVDEVWDQFSIELLELIDADPHVVTVFEATGRGHGSGIEVRAELSWVWTLHDGRVVRVEGDFDRAAALEAAGLSE
jgi:ketosteroid isomerase-like protein